MVGEEPSPDAPSQWRYTLPLGCGCDATLARDGNCGCSPIGAFGLDRGQRSLSGWTIFSLYGYDLRQRFKQTSSRSSSVAYRPNAGLNGIHCLPLSRRPRPDKLNRLDPQIMPRPPSPCKDICALDTKASICTGCGRTLGEIAEWGSAIASCQHEIVRRSSARMGSRASRPA